MKKVLTIMLVFIMITLLYGCKTKTKIIEVPTTKTEYVYKDSIKYDSIYVKDSIYIEKSDSIVYVNKILYKYKYKYLTKTDSVLVTDTIFKPYEKIVEVEVEKPLTHIQSFFLVIGKIVFILLIIFVLAVVLMKYLKKR